MNEDEEVDADDLATEVETDRTRQKTRRDLAKFRQQERVQMPQLSKKKIRTFASHFSSIFIVFDHEITDYVLGFFHQGKFAGSLLVKILLAYS